MKKSFLFVLTLLILLSGCAKKQEEKQKQWTFAFVPKLLDNPVFQVAWQGAQAGATELGNGKVIVERFAPVKSDAVEQAQIIESLIERKVDGIAVSVNDADALKESIDKAMDAGIPVVTFDSDAPASKRISYYGTHNVNCGKKMGELLVKTMGTKGNIGILMGTPGAPNLEERKNALLEYLKGYPDIKVVATEFCYDDVNKAVSVMEAAIQAHPEMTGWVLPGAWALFTPPPGPFASKKPGDFTVISIDALPEQLDYVRQGYVNILLGQKLYEWGYESIRALIAIKEGKKVEEIIDSGLDEVTKENVEEYAKKWESMQKSK
jgi:ribose transport system substrate-binding protein